MNQKPHLRDEEEGPKDIFIQHPHEVNPENPSEGNTTAIAANAPEESRPSTSGSIGKVFELATGAFISRAAGAKERKVVSKYDTTKDLSYKRVIVSDTGNQFNFTDDAEEGMTTRNVAALKFLDKVRDPSPSQELPTVLSAEEIAVSVVDDKTFNTVWKDDIARLCDESKSQVGNYFIGNDEIAASARMTGKM